MTNGSNDLETIKEILFTVARRYEATDERLERLSGLNVWDKEQMSGLNVLDRNKKELKSSWTN